MSVNRSRIPIAQLRLSLRKPKDWDVSLTTFTSSRNVVVPDIVLHDETGRIIIDTSGSDKAIKERSVRKSDVESRRNEEFSSSSSSPVANEVDSETKSRNHLNRSAETKRRKGDEKFRETKKPDRVILDKENSDNGITSSAGKKFRENFFSVPDADGLKRNKIEKSDVEIVQSRIPRLSRSGNENGKRTLLDEVASYKIKPKEGDYFFELNGVPFGSYEEASALFRGASEIVRLRVSSRKSKNDQNTAVTRRSKRRLVNSKDSGMGSNVSRHSGKGLSGRRTQSSGNLCNGAKILAPRVGRILNPCGTGGVSPRDRNKFCGSLPNHLDEKEIRSGDCTPESLYNGNNNYGEVYARHRQVQRTKNVELVFHKLLPQQDIGGGDQGYGSERSPEDEQPPSLPTELPYRRHHYSTIRRNKEFPFITKENTFEARLEKGSRGLGLSVTGGVDTTEQYPGLIRIKRIFPHQPAWECGELQLGDVILAVNGVPLTGLTNYEALEVLRTTPSDVALKVCRPPGDIFSIPPQNVGEPPPPPRRDPARVISSSQTNNSSVTLPLPQLIAEPYGEFDVVLKKVNGSLGFTLRKEDESVLGHYVRALVREPALSDGRIRPGDKIVSVNGIDISPMSHEEAVMFLRQSGEEVHLRLYRDLAQTPVSALSPTESHKTFKPKPALRKEAMDMLCDLAVKKLSPSDSSSSSGRSRLRSSSPGSSPRRRKLTKTPPETENNEEKPQRPNFLDLCGDGTLRRHKFQLVTCVGGDEDADSVLTGTSSEHTQTTVGSATRACISSDECNSDQDGIFSNEPSSMPPMTTSTSVFSYKNPIYQSAHPAVHSESEATTERLSDQDIPDKVFNGGGGSQGLLKWKGVLFTPEDGVDDDEDDNDDAKEKAEFNHSQIAKGEGQVLTVELTRGWNSRLGFSLQGSESGTYISAIYADSVAAKDGRLQPGDLVIMINDESTEGMTTSDIIDLLRKIRGTIAITVLRSSSAQS